MKLCTTIIPTVGRSSLERTIESALTQDIDPDLHDIIVINDSGKPLVDLDFFQHPRVTLVNSNRCGPCVARNIGAAMAHSKYLNFLDDDDYLMPGGLKALFEVAETSNAVWIYGALHCVDNEGTLIFDNQPPVKGNLFSHFVVGEVLSLSPSIVDRECFFKVGGFDSMILPSEDRHLACRLALIGDFDRTDKFVATARRGVEGSSIDDSKMKASSRAVREMGLDLPGALARIRASVKDDVHLRGRACRAYLFSSVLNLTHGNICLAAKRLVSCLPLAAYYIVLPDFWGGVSYKLANRRGAV